MLLVFDRGHACPLPSSCNVEVNVFHQHRNNDIRQAKLRQMPLRGHDLNDRVAANVLVEVLRDHDGHRQVLHALDDVARDSDEV